MQKPAHRKSSNLEEAISLLIHTQAAFVSQLVETKRRTEKTIEEIRDEFSQIKAMLLRHERILSELPETIWQKIGFQPS